MSLLHQAKKSGDKFLNPVPTHVGSPAMILKVLPLYLRNREETEPKVRPGPFNTDVSIYNTVPASGLRVTWFGHASALLEIDGMRVLIDPVWDERASPFSWLGPKRFFAPTMSLWDMPEVDAVLISHDHYDHLGAESIKMLSLLPQFAKTRWVTSLGVGKLLQKFWIKHRIKELDWTETFVCAGRSPGCSLKITALPARHFSGRGMLNRFKTLWSSFVLESRKHRVYFGADSGWWEGFTEIGAQYGPFDLTMLEIGAFHPLWHSIHLGPEGAARAYEHLGGPEKAGLLMPIHWGLFNLALHGWRQPMERLTELAQARAIPLWSPEPGCPTDMNGTSYVSDWWKR